MKTLLFVESSYNELEIWELKLDHLSLPLLLAAQLKVLGSLDRFLIYRRRQIQNFLVQQSNKTLLSDRTYLVLPLALSTLQPQNQLLGCLSLLPQNRLGLPAEPLLLSIVPETLKFR